MSRQEKPLLLLSVGLFSAQVLKFTSHVYLLHIDLLSVETGQIIPRGRSVHFLHRFTVRRDH